MSVGARNYSLRERERIECRCAELFIKRELSVGARNGEGERERERELSVGAELFIRVVVFAWSPSV